MSPLRKPEAERRSVVISLRLTEEEHEALVRGSLGHALFGPHDTLVTFVRKVLLAALAPRAPGQA